VSSRADVLRQAAELGATVHDDTARHRSVPASEHDGEVVLDAPPGQLWVGNGCHTWVLRSEIGQRFPWADAGEAMAYGIEPCPDAGSGCEWCDEGDADRAALATAREEDDYTPWDDVKAELGLDDHPSADNPDSVKPPEAGIARPEIQ
jgi:hypothetical protein